MFHWLKNHPNDFIHRQTRQRLAAFLRERVALFPLLNELYVKLQPLSSIHYFNTWRWPHHPHEPRQGIDSRSSSVSSTNHSDEDSDPGFYDTIHSEDEMDEDREWGLFDEDETLPELQSGKKAPSVNMESLSPFTHLMTPGSPGTTPRYPSKAVLPRDRRSSTGSFAHNLPSSSACAMETFVAGRRGSASSATSNSGPFTPSLFSEGDLTPLQLQPMAPIPVIGKRSSSQSYRRSLGSGNLSTSSTATNSSTTLSSTIGSDKDHLHLISHPLTGPAAAAATAALVFKDTMMEERVHPFQQGHGRTSPLSIHHHSLNSALTDQILSPMSIPFMDIKDVAIAAQLTCVEYGLFKKLKVKEGIT